MPLVGFRRKTSCASISVLIAASWPKPSATYVRIDQSRAIPRARSRPVGMAGATLGTGPTASSRGNQSPGREDFGHQGIPRRPGWMIAEPYTTNFKVTDESRDVARRLLAALGA